MSLIWNKTSHRKYFDESSRHTKRPRNCPFPWGTRAPQPVHGSLSPHAESTLRIASGSVRPFVSTAHGCVQQTDKTSGVARIWRWGHRGSGERKSPAGSRGRAPGGWLGGGIASRKLIAVIKDIWLPNRAQFCVFSSTNCAARNFLVNPVSGGGGVPPLLRQWIRHTVLDL